MAYKVKTEDFEGPLDLLLSLAEKEKVDILKIKLADICDQFIASVAELEEKLDLAELADYLVIASQLLVIKSRALLPILEPEDEEEVDEMQLKWRLMEYKKFRKAGQIIAKLLGSKNITFERQIYTEEKVAFMPPPGFSVEMLGEVLADLLAKLPAADLLDEKKMGEVVTLDQKIAEIRKNIQKTSELSFNKILGAARSKTEVIVSFLAMLELLKQRLVVVEQGDLFGEIKVKRYQKNT